MKPHEEQSALEHVLRARLWQPVDRKRRMEEAIPGHVRKKNYSEAGECQKQLREAEREIAMWENILRLYEAEETARELERAQQSHVAKTS